MKQNTEESAKRGKNDTGWTKPNKNERSVRDREHGLQGQDLWYQLQKLGFIHRGDNLQKEKNDPLTAWEMKLKNWLIWGYFEKDR